LVYENVCMVTSLPTKRMSHYVFEKWSGGVLWRCVHACCSRLFLSSICVSADALICGTLIKARFRIAGRSLNVFFRLVNVYTSIILITTKLCLPITFRSLPETFVRRSCLVLLAVLATVVMWRGKKSLVRVAQCTAALIPVHRTPSLLSDVHCFLPRDAMHPRY